MPAAPDGSVACLSVARRRERVQIGDTDMHAGEALTLARAITEAAVAAIKAEHERRMREADAA